MVPPGTDAARRGVLRGATIPRVTATPPSTKPPKQAGPEALAPYQPPPEGLLMRALGWLVWALLHAACLLFQALPAFLVFRLGDLLGLVFAVITRRREPRSNRRHRGAIRNMRIAFGPETDPARLRALTRDYARHLGYLLIEFLRIGRWTPERARQQFAPGVLERIEVLRAAGKGVICVTGHIGNWELLSYMAGKVGLPMTVVTRPVGFGGVRRFLADRRDRSGVVVLPKYGSMWALRKRLQAGGIVGLVADENARKGAFVPFFGVLAATNQTAYQLQRATKAPIVVLTCQRETPDRYQIRIWAELEHVPGEARAVGTERVLGGIMGGLEAAIRTHPEQYWWALRRWETRPPGESYDAQGLPPRV